MPKREILAGEKDRNRFCYLYVYHNQLKWVNLSPSVTVKAAAVTGMNHLAILGEHTAAGKTFEWLGKKPLAPCLPISLSLSYWLWSWPYILQMGCC